MMTIFSGDGDDNECFEVIFRDSDDDGDDG